MPSVWLSASLKPSWEYLGRAFGRLAQALLPGVCGLLAVICVSSRSVVKRPALPRTASKWFGNLLALRTPQWQLCPHLTRMAGMSALHGCTAFRLSDASTAARSTTIMSEIASRLLPAL